MSFKQATTEAPASADFVAYQQIGGWVIATRNSGGVWDVCANTNSEGYNVFVAGVAARKQSLWSLESRQFICGDVGQLDSVED